MVFKIIAILAHKDNTLKGSPKFRGTALLNTHIQNK